MHASASVAETECPVCRMAFPEEEAESLGAFKVVIEGATHWLDSSSCKEAFEKAPARFLSRKR